MAQVIESAVTETRKQVINNPRVEIDTNPPFESVKEAVDHFGGGGRWFPGQNLLRLTDDQVGSSFPLHLYYDLIIINSDFVFSLCS